MAPVRYNTKVASLHPLVAALDKARAAHPGLAVSAGAFLGHLARHLPPELELEAALASACVEDLYLAYACACGEAQAIAEVKRLVREELGRLASLGDPQDLESLALEHLFGSTPPRVAAYAARGSLRAWLRVACVRLALRHARKGAAEVASEEAAFLGLDAPSGDAELDYLKSRYRAEFASAFKEALRSLRPRELNLLRQHYLDGLSTGQLAALYQVHRATLVRWLADARQALLSQTRDALGRRLQIQRLEVDSIIRLIRSQLDVSLPIFLSSEDDG